MRMIDADELIKTLESFMDLPDPGYAMGIGRAIWLVKDAPTIPAPQWISVEDKWPQNGQWVVAYLYDGNIVCGVYYDAVGFTLDYCYEGQGEVSHWMPTPEPPEEVRDDGTVSQ